MRALMNLAIEPALKIYEVSADIVLQSSSGTRTAVKRVLKVLADTPAGAVRIVRERYPKSRCHAVLSQALLPPPAAWA
ncbi:MAG: hypothetical protein HZB72_06365 [Burkholderiales bacterium]|nr:hypothetical protein [Burkholderiales bacterium]